MAKYGRYYRFGKQKLKESQVAQKPPKKPAPKPKPGKPFPRPGY